MARVLVVDDAAFMRKMVSDALTEGGHEVVGEAGNGVGRGGGRGCPCLDSPS
jgi:two-component system chemotaxis response regulator CheY